MLHPKDVIELIVAAVPVLILLIAAAATRRRRVILYLAACLVVCEIGFFTLRSFWIDYQVAKKTEQLNQYLRKAYPDETWMIERKTGRQYDPYHLDVTFSSEPGWIYTYSVGGEGK
ncbi:hypothetical protein [Brevibacillus massiliensis]|uniref:hypothetical protein n=1 Tax=Brevibacillus massiliensis TaxID=1118054 RepID=UPI0002FBF0C1|nr:hypothetical protein [Brevibacillus massiliensis]